MASCQNVAVSSREITGYWDNRAQSYYNGVVGELGDSRRIAWERVIDCKTSGIAQQAQVEGRAPRVLDIGCGPGFFSVLFAERGYTVDAVDASANMLDRAQANVRAFNVEERVTFHQGDVAVLPFAENTFDVAVLRNVTWLMREPEAAYAEWLSVLKPGGKLLVFDANWYRYLIDPAIDAARRADQEGNRLEGWDDEAQATAEEKDRCAEMAMSLPLTPVLRPQWDVEYLTGLGVSSVQADERIWMDVWTENEKSFYGSSPMFLVEVAK